MDQRKRERLEQFRDELDAGGVVYHPFAVSCWGRLHPAAPQMLQNVAKRLARREGNGSQRAVLRRLQARVATEVVRRAARMAIHCLPCPSASDEEAVGIQGPPMDTIISAESSLRAGDPGSVVLPSYLVLPSGTAVGS